MKKFRLCSLFLAAAILLGACGGNPSVTKPPETTAPPETEAPVEPIVLAADGVSDYIIVRPDFGYERATDAAIFLRKYMEKCGVKIKITTDWEGNGKVAHEIVVGTTLRTAEDGCRLDAHSVGEEGYYAYASDGRIFIGGGSDEVVMAGVELFLSDFFGYAGDAEKASPVPSVTVPGNYENIVRQKYALESVTVGGRDIAEFHIDLGETLYSRTSDTASAPASKGDKYRALTEREAKRAAEKIQAAFYSSAGVWLPIETGADGPAIRFDASPASAEGHFEMLVADGDLVLRTALSGGHERGFAQFAAAYLNDAKGTLDMNQDFHFDADIGSYVTYSEFGAVGDGKTNDIDAIIKAHEYANANHLKVKADAGATYYIGAASSGAIVKTDTDWTDASFIIDDSGVGIDRRNVCVFTVTATESQYTPTEKPGKLVRSQTNLGITLPKDSIVVLTDSTTKRYIREGKNANSGSDQTDILVVDKDGNIDMNAPLIWDYDTVTSIRVIPMDEETLTLTGGTFTTIANNQPSASTYYARGIKIVRSNVVVENLTHYVTGEGETGAPYSGILVINDCANILVRNCTFTAHKTYQNNAKGLGTVSQGTYDISPARVVNLTFENCTQTTDILDTKYWGIMGSNFCKNITVDGCTFSRFDAHQGVANVTIRNSTLGHQCLNAIGCGTLTVENSTLYGSSFINLRNDYGSTWEGDVVIKNCTWIPNRGNGAKANTSLIGGSYSGFHDFGYPCYMPARITIDGLTVKDGKHASDYKGINLLGNITSAYTSAAYEKKVETQGFPYHITENITISNFTSESGLKWNLSQNKFMFRNVVVNDLDAAN